MNGLFDIIKELSHIDSVTGSEQKFAEKIKEMITADIRLFEDRLGNLVYSRGRDNSLLLAAHMDEPGIIATSIKSNGRIKFDAIGGIKPESVFGKRVSFGGVFGTVECVPPHLLSGENLGKIPNISDMTVDIGCDTKEQTERYVKGGDCAALMSELREFGQKRFCCKGLSRLFSCAVLIYLINNTEISADFLFAVKNEAGFAGAKAAAFGKNYSSAIVFSAAESLDCVSKDEQKAGCFLGKGAAVAFKGKNIFFDREYYNGIFEIAEQNGIKLQQMKACGLQTAAEVLQTSGGGMRVLPVLLPVRNFRTANETADKTDLESAKSIARLFCEKYKFGE